MGGASRGHWLIRMGGGLLFVARRLVALVVTLLIASILIYGAVAIAPGDPVAALAGGTPPNPKVVAQIRQEFHLNEPFLGQYWHWLSGAVHGDFGRSLTFRSDVGSLISSRLKTSLLLVAYSGILIISVGVSLGVLAALRGRFTNTAVTVGTTIAMGAPSFVVART